MTQQKERPNFEQSPTSIPVIHSTLTNRHALNRPVFDSKKSCQPYKSWMCKFSALNRLLRIDLYISSPISAPVFCQTCEKLRTLICIRFQHNSD